MTLHLMLTAPAAVIEATDTETRILAGVAIPYGEAGYTSGGLLSIDAGAVKIPENLKRVKLFREHGRTSPVGFAVSASETPTHLAMSFQVGRTPDGDAALIDAAEGIRDGLSVELSSCVIDAGRVVSAELVGVAQVAIPAFAGAVLTASQTPDTTPEPETPDTTEETTEEEEAMPETIPEEVEATMPATMSALTLPAERRSVATAKGLEVFASAAADALRGATDASQVNAALSDVTPANSGSADIFPRPAWLGQLWEPQSIERPIVNAIGVKPLTGMLMQGWKWGVKPEVAPYAGNKAAIPSNQPTIVPAEAPAQRIAGGWDLDRIYVDFNTGFVEAFLQAAVQDYKKKSQTYFLDGHGAVTGPPAVPAADGIIDDAFDLGAQADALTAISAVAGYLTGNGANVSFLAMASDVFADFLALDSSSVPWWLQNQAAVNLTGSTTVAGITIGVDPGLAAGTVVGGDRDAVSLWETGPINVQAINLPNGGVDLAVFGYWGQMVHDADGLAKATVTAVLGDAPSSSSTRKAKSS